MDDPRHSFRLPPGSGREYLHLSQSGKEHLRQYLAFRRGIRYMPTRPPLWRRIWRWWPWALAMGAIGGLATWLASEAI